MERNQQIAIEPTPCSSVTWPSVFVKVTAVSFWKNGQRCNGAPGVCLACKELAWEGMTVACAAQESRDTAANKRNVICWMESLQANCR